MIRLSAKSQITIGLSGLVVSILCLLLMLGIIPDSRKLVMEGRADLCEAIAISCSDSISRGETKRLERFLQLLVERNPQLLSAGVRKADGALICDIAEHRKYWNAEVSDKSTDHFVLVPIRSGNDRWGNVELAFEAQRAAGWFGWLQHPWLRLTLLAGGLSFIGFHFYLGKMLRHLDPSKTVPKRVRQALDSLAEGLLVIDREGQIVLANQALATWVACDPEKLVGVEATSLAWVQSEAGEPLREFPWIKALVERVPQAGIMLGLAREGEPTRILMANASPVLGQDGQYRGVLVSFGDVTQLEETKRGLNEAKHVAEEANRAKSDFLARMSHEIRTPMNAILGYTDVLRRGFDENVQERQDYLNTIHGSGEHLLALINDILDLSKIESGRMELDLNRGSPAELLHQVMSVLVGKAEEKGLQLKLVGKTPLPETILTDAVRLRQSIMNLVGNAIKFTETGSVTLEASLLQHSSKPMLRIDVVDTGIGIDPTAVERIFTPFSQADNSITRRFGGTGLGLSISKQLAEALGGSIEVISQPGQGSRFSLTISTGSLAGVESIELQSSSKRLAHRPAKSNAVAQLPPARILVADDGESNRKLVKLVLSRAGVEVVTVENGQEAVDEVTKGHFDLVLMDMQMPVMDGYTATTTLRNLGIHLPIIALTANAMQGDEEKCRAAGCTGFLTKPINIDRLISTIAAYLNEQPQWQSNLEALRRSEEQDLRELHAESERLSECVAIAAGTDQGLLLPLISSLPQDDEEFREIAAEFVLRLQEKVHSMQTARQCRDYVELAALAHWLKGSGGTAGFDAFTVPAKNLNEGAKRCDEQHIGTALEEIVRLVARIKQSSSLGPLSRA